jgi:hypothetical protein
MRDRLQYIALPFVVLALLAGAQGERDGAVIVNSGSTNSAGYSIALWSDATVQASIQGQAAAVRSLPRDLADRFFADVRAARTDAAPPSHCMKSASFGSTTTVGWHGWRSPDLQCPPFSASLRALASDVRAIESAAGIPSAPIRRVRLPLEPRKIPETPPEVSPT